ncbi:hypothetical protein ET475_05735 [Microbacterium protaetiae]|uniref:Uncharacterized protein n=1 Tax=Microbacterium protaetiae TaxID=2509458 RepID=A0A4P6EDX1_9MICO|nr:hypothetical protein [Microbacterium protaetiae]QAY59533.1 hypothetical protein ET475_05735 [Microbacterium protaetiae]
MDLAVYPIIVIVGASEIRVKEQPVDVAVLHDRELVRWLEKRPATLDDSARQQITVLASDASTWPSVSRQNFVDVAAFDELQREVRGAKRVRIIWAMLGPIAAIAAAGALLLNVMM